MTIQNLSKSLESCLNDVDFQVNVFEYCQEFDVQLKQFSDIDLVSDNNGIIAIIEGKTHDSFGWFVDFAKLEKKNFKYFKDRYETVVQKAQRRLHSSLIKKDIMCFCTIGENVLKPGYAVEKIRNKSSIIYTFTVPLQNEKEKDAHPCYHNSLFIYCLFPSCAMKKKFITWFETETVDKQRVGIKYEEGWSLKKPGLFIYAKGYKNWREDWEQSPKGNMDNRDTLNNIPSKFLHHIGKFQ